MHESEIRDRIRAALTANTGKTLRRRQIYKLVGVKHLDYDDFKRILDEYEREGGIARRMGRHFTLPGEGGEFTGRFSANRNGGGFVRTPDGGSFYIADYHTAGALTGDTVQATTIKHATGPTQSAKILRVIERSVRPVVALFRKPGKTAWVVPRDDTALANIPVRKGGELTARDGDLVVVKIDPALVGQARPQCTVTEVLGDPAAPGMDVLAVAKRYGLAVRFPDEVLAEAGRVPDDLTPEIIAARRDLRGIVTFTIDPVDAKDFDDAISVRPLADGTVELGIHIADVAHYVAEDSPMDMEARERGMSCYLVDRVIPMLPERLSNTLCSLRPDEDRLTKSVLAVISPEGDILSAETADTVIHSRMRLTYEQVQAFLDGRAEAGADHVVPEAGEALRLLEKLTDRFIALRSLRGALDLELPETKVVLAADGTPTDIIRYVRLKAHRMVEEAMLIANIVVAKALAKRGSPILYRVHESPDPVKLDAYAETAKALGFDFSPARALSDETYIQSFLTGLSGTPYERVLNMFLLRSMKKAVYTPDNRGHYGLSLPVYAHFTSPIRRYPDLVVHRQLERAIHRGDGNGKYGAAYYESLGEQVTEREILTTSAERDSVKMKMAQYMEALIGEEFEGTVSGMLAIGFFVELDRLFVEGLVHVSTLDDDYYQLDETGVGMSGKRTGRHFRIGDRVRVAMAAADILRGRIDFVLLEKIGEERPTRPPVSPPKQEKPGKPGTRGNFNRQGAGKSARRGAGKKAPHKGAKPARAAKKKRR